MDRFDIYKDIAERTQGDIYIGVVGPVRTGKSTFIKRFMDLLVIPNIENAYQRERAKDELPQSGAGKTITTTEPKFIPNEAVEIVIKENAKLRVRLVDCVGYLVKGVLGHLENNMPRMLATPWFEQQIPFEEAAETGTKKVITEHSTIGIVVTTDGSITELSRENYIEAEERVIKELKEINKPFVVVLNSTRPSDSETIKLKESLEDKYNVPVIPIDCMRMQMENIHTILEKILFEFPVREININLPGWIEGLETSHWLKRDLIFAVRDIFRGANKLRDVQEIIPGFKEIEIVKNALLDNMQMGEGITTIELMINDGLFYKVLSEYTGYTIDGEHQLLGLIKELAKAKKEYSRVEQALKDVKETGYGMVAPSLEELELDEPEIFRHGNRFGVKLRANAPSLHFLRADINTEVSPIVGTEKQSEELVKYLLQEFESDPSKLWQSNMFGKSLHDLVKEQLQNKLFMMPEDTRSKLQQTLERIINDGSGGLICIIL